MERSQGQKLCSQRQDKVARMADPPGGVNLALTIPPAAFTKH
jgi:hypothetical protein